MTSPMTPRMAPPITPADGDTSLIGMRLGNYRVCEEIGRGGMAVVYRAEHIAQRIEQAIKVLRLDKARDPAAVTRLRREALVYRRVACRGMPVLSDCGTLTDGRPYLQMELLRGDPLRRRIPSHGIPVQEAVLLAWQISRSLCSVHEAQVVHRDLKPENIMVVYDDSEESGVRCIVLDFGIAQIPDGACDLELSDPHAEDHHASALSSRLGTPGYMSKEQWLSDSQLDGRSDVYALGIILFEMLCGEPPYLGSFDHVQHQHFRSRPPSIAARVATVPPTLDRLICRMMSSDRRRRPWMHEVTAQLASFLGKQTGDPRYTLSALRPDEPVQHFHERMLLSTQAGVPGPAHAVLPRWRELSMPVALALLALVSAPLPPSYRLRNHPLLAIPPVASRSEMVHLPATVVQLGSSDAEIESTYRQAQADGCTVCPHSLYERERETSIQVSGFQIDPYEVTNSVVTAVLNPLRNALSMASESGRTVLYYGGRPILGLDNPHGMTGVVWRAAEKRLEVISDMASKPAVNITWYGADLVCRLLLKRLPSEAKWEFAARGPERRTFPWGHERLPCDQVRYGVTTFMRPFCLSNSEGPLAVQRLNNADRTPEGVYDLAGNVSEWVDDVFSQRYPRCDGPCRDFVEPPAAVTAGDPDRAIRGGSWQQEPTALRGASRYRASPGWYDEELGFRCAL